MAQHYARCVLCRRAAPGPDVGLRRRRAVLAGCSAAGAHRRVGRGRSGLRRRGLRRLPCTERRGSNGDGGAQPRRAEARRRARGAPGRDGRPWHARLRRAADEGRDRRGRRLRRRAGREEHGARSRPPSSRTTTKLADCKADSACFEQAFGNLAYYEGPKRALAVFTGRSRPIRPSRLPPHRARTRRRCARALRRRCRARRSSTARAVCWSGYYHGILERAFAGVLRGSSCLPSSRRLCASAAVRRTDFIALPVRPRARPRADDLHRLRPAGVAGDVRRSS